ncbi:ribokinase [Candidatus Poriferisocius sp.]|uniref:ribokinase n=1 Tax=Candidatus Poriferisocius sp. TaxID=3101276 RepID=UPI003B5995A9
MGQASAPCVVVIGSTMIDLVTYADRLPESGETVVGSRFQMGFGGKGANQAVMARRLGAQVAMVNCLGNDGYGDMTVDNFVSLGIDISQVHRVEGSSGVAPIWVEPDGSNRIIIVPGANHAMEPEQARRGVEAFEAQVVVGQLEIPQSVTTAGFEAARSRGVPTILNPAPAASLEQELLAATDWLVPNEVEFRTLTGSSADDDVALAEFSTATDARLVVTLGELGVAIVGADGTVTRLPAPAVDAVDTTGAGDAFVGAFAYGVAAGLDDDQAVRLGITCASHSVTRAGTQSSFPDPEWCAQQLSRP